MQIYQTGPGFRYSDSYREEKASRGINYVLFLFRNLTASGIYARLFVPLLLALIVDGCSPTRRLKEGEHLLNRNVIVEESGKVDKSEMANYIKQKPNRKLLYVYPFYLGIHNIYDEEKTKIKREKRDAKIVAKNNKRKAKNKKPKSSDRLMFREWVRDIGEAPVIIDTTLVKKSSKQLSLYLATKGYFNNTVRDSVKYYKKKATAYYIVNPGIPYTIRNLNYSIADTYLDDYVFNDTILSLITRGDNYDVDVLQNERDRITKRLLNLGFYDFTKEYIHYEIDSALNTHQLDITLSINNFLKPVPEIPDSFIETNHKQYHINNVFIYPDHNPNPPEGITPDTIIHDGIYIIHYGKLKYRPFVLSSAVFLHKGELYQLTNAEKTYLRFSNLRAFKLVNVRFAKTPGQEGILDAYITLSPIPKHSYNVETMGTNTYGNLGISGSVFYQNRNLFKGLEVLEIKFRGGIEAQRLANKDLETNQPFNTVEFGPEVKLDVPRFLVPYKINTSKNADPRTTFTSFFNYQRRPDYTRYATSIAYGYTWRETPQKRHTINPLEITSVKIERGEGFDSFLDRTNDFLILNSYTDHLITATRYTFQYSNQDIKRKTDFTYFKGNIEFSGNLLRGIYNLAGAPQDTGGSYRIDNIRFSQYIRSDIDYRRYFTYSENRVLVMRLFAGIGKPLHNLRVLPFEKSFFAGGSNDIRAWRARSLGPGSFQSVLGRNFDQIGDGQLEANIEYRFKIIKVLNGALFVDAGNIWLRKPDPLRPGGEFRLNNFHKEIAIGSGFGLRADFNFFIIRLDLGFKMRDPAFAEKDRWVVNHFFDRKWKDDFRELYGYKYSFANFNLGIGYPF